jgi:hypothetical protein
MMIAKLQVIGFAIHPQTSKHLAFCAMMAPTPVTQMTMI